MSVYWENNGGRYGTGESYEYFPKYEDGVDTYDSDDGLWTYTYLDKGIEILRYNGDEKEIIIPAEIMGEKVVSLESTFDGFDELREVTIPEGIIAMEGTFYGCEKLNKVVL